MPLLLSGPASGLFSKAGHPSAANDELSSSESMFAASWDRQTGSYRRPLDPGAVSRPGLSAAGWSSARSMTLFGRARVNQERHDPGTQSDVFEPSSSPFVLTDTSRSPVRRLSALVEGGGSWRTGPWRLGLSLGYEARNSRTITAPFTRSLGGTVVGGSGGLLWKRGRLALGSHARGRRRTEYALLNRASAFGEVRDLKGYQEVPSTEVLSEYRRWTEETAWSVGPDVAWESDRVKAFVTGELSRLRLNQWRAELNAPPKDRWRVSGWNAVTGILWRITEEVRLSGDVQLARIAGTAREPGADSAIVSATELVLRTGITLWFRPEAESGFQGVLATGLGYESRQREDFVARATSDIQSSVPWFQLEVARVLRRTRIGIGGGLLGYVPSSRIPDASDRGPAYNSLIAGELALFATSAVVPKVVTFVEQRVGSNKRLWFHADFQRVLPSGSRPPETPAGSRTAVAFRAGVRLGVTGARSR